MNNRLKVIDFNPQEFEEFLNQTFHQEDFTSTTLILGIEDGGKPLADFIFNFLSSKFTQNQFHVNFVKCQRPSTKEKKRNLLTENVLKSTFRWLPKSLLNYLRVLEHQKLMKFKHQNTEREINYNHPIDWQKFSKILIVDDAVDSGATLFAVLNSVKTNVKNCVTIKTLAVVTTSDQAKIKPDYSLYQQVLVRFPWSLDG